jgi:predicted dehydrogenase
MWYRDQAYFDVPWRGRWSAEGGGPTMGHGSHQIDPLLALLGEWIEVRAMAGRHIDSSHTAQLPYVLDAMERGERPPLSGRQGR